MQRDTTKNIAADIFCSIALQVKLPSDPQNIPLFTVDMTAHICNTGLCTGSEQNAIAEVTLHHNTHQQYAQKLRSNAILLLKAECSHSGCEPKLNADTQWASGSLQNALYSVQCVLHFANNFTICKVCISHRARNLEMKMFFFLPEFIAPARYPLSELR